MTASRHFWERPGFWPGAAVLFALLIFFCRLGSDGMYAPQEGRTAIIVRNMLLSGNYMDMTVPGGVPYEKPVGHYWLCVPTAKLFGLADDPMTVSPEWALRLPSALCALLAIAFTALLAKDVYGKRCAVIAIVVLASCATFTNLGRVAHIDMPLTAAYAGAMAALWFGCLRTGRSNWMIYLFYLALGWGMVLKGPLPVILAGLVILAMVVKERNWKLLWELRPLSGGALFLLTALPWYVAENVRTDGGFFDEFIVNQNLRRFTGVGSTYRNGERMSYFYYFPKFFAGLLPWSIPALLAAVPAFPKWRKCRFSSGSWYLLFWVGTGFVFFSLSALKRGDYLLPLYPAAAILMSRLIERAAAELPALSRKWRYGFWGIAALMAAAYVLVLARVVSAVGERVASGQWRFMSKRDGMNLAMFSDFAAGHWLLTVAGVLAALGFLYALGRLMEKRRHFAALGLFAVLVLGLFSLYHGLLQPGTDQQKSVKPFIREARRFVPPGTVVIYPDDFNTELIFFMDRPYRTGDSAEGEDAVVISSPEWAAEHDGKGYEILAATPERHQYPAVLLRRVSTPAKAPSRP